MPRGFSTVRRLAQRDVRPRHARVRRVGLNDLFALFPELPRFQHRPLPAQGRRMREQVERIQERAGESVSRHPAAAARVKGSWSARRG